MSLLNELKKCLKEDFLSADMMRGAFGDQYVEIFKHPTYREVKDIATSEDNDEGSIRFGVDEQGILYGWIYQILHSDMEKHLDKKWTLRFEYTEGHDTVWTGSGTYAKDWDQFGNADIVDQLQKALPKMKKIEMQTRPFKVLWEA